jgi:hypothetical protein
VLLAWLMNRGAGLWIGLTVTLAAASASTVHYLARPHITSLLLFPISLWILDRDRRRPGARVWWLVAISGLWANLHGGFAAWLGCLVLLLLTEALQRQWPEFRRHGMLALACLAATLANPYGWRLHEHIIRYLGSSWILENVQEFQSPRIRSENMLVFAVLLLVGAAVASRAWARRQWFEAALVWVWGFAALRSARHAPLYVIVAVPVIASECARLWQAAAERYGGRSPAAILWKAGQQLGGAHAVSLWAPLLVLVGWLGVPALADFPASRFPVTAVTENLARLAPPGRIPRVLTSDVWAGYLIFRLYPRQRVFFDGRSDFYGPAVGNDYLALLTVGPGWAEVLNRYGFEIAFLPREWTLGGILERDPDWQLVYRDTAASVFVRRTAVKANPLSAECLSGAP